MARTLHTRGAGAGLGTFAGVFTPSVLTILGLVLFRIHASVVGGAGVGLALFIVFLSLLLTVLTSLSLSAIATNIRVKGGGDYYLISRSLGIEFGGAIGLVLFMAQSVSIAFYCAGLGEAVVALVGLDWLEDPRLVAVPAALLLFGCSWAGADVATRFQFGIMGILGSAILSFLIGGVAGFSGETLRANWSEGTWAAGGFWLYFALFFPAVTGFTQGVSMSGELANPGKSLPRGTFLAIGVSAVVYLLATVLFGGSQGSGELGPESMGQIAWLGALIPAGLMAATLSSGLTSFLGAPRILQALSRDRIFPVLKPFAKGSGALDNPRRGVLLSLGIALLFLALGDTEFIAQIVTMFFLISYGLLNYATAFEARAQSPSFRPRFRWFDHRLSILGAAGCLGAMLMIDPFAGALALAVLFALYQYVDRLGRPDRWADSKRNHYFQRVRRDLLAISQEPEHPRNWRPRLVVFSDNPERRGMLVRFATWVEGGAGVTSVVRVLVGDQRKLRPKVQKAQAELEREVAESGLEAFPLVVAAADLEAGALTVLQAHGIGPLRANTLLVNVPGGKLQEDPDDGEDRKSYLRFLGAAVRYDTNLIVLGTQPEAWDRTEATPSAARVIDVWWQDDDSSHLMLLLAYMMTRSESWAAAKIRVLTHAQPRARERTLSKLAETLEAVRIDAETVTVDEWNAATLCAASAQASLVFMPVRLGRVHLVGPFDKPAAPLLEELPLVAMVLAAEEIDLEAEPEEGELGELAEATDARDSARARLAELEAALTKAQAVVDAAQEEEETLATELRVAREDPPSPEAIDALHERHSAALDHCAESRAELERATRLVEKAQARLAVTEEGLEALVGEAAGTEEG